MPRGRYNRVELNDFKGGINIEPENAKPNQVLDARNVWCPHGILEQRPGYTGIAKTGLITSNTPLANNSFIRETPAGTYVAGAVGPINFPVSALPQESAYWLGIPSADWNSATFKQGLRTGSANVNTNATYVLTQYWNGTDWIHLPSINESADGGGAHGPHLSQAFDYRTFVAPEDWAERTVTIAGVDYTGLFLRFVIKGANLSAGTTVQCGGPCYDTYKAILRGLFYPQFVTSARYLTLFKSFYQIVINSAELTSVENTSTAPRYVILTGPEAVDTLPASMTVIPQFDEAFIGYDHVVSCHTAVPSTTDLYQAQLEARPEFVGTTFGLKSDYHPDYVPQLGEFPRANYVEFFQGQLWVAGLLDEPYTIRWSAPSPAYKVWPNESYEILMENDNSPITGLKATSEYLAVFKQDSIWLMVPSATSELSGLNTYIPVRRVGGVGCVANSSIIEINGNLIFLAEDGVYAFDGQTAHKLTDALDHFFLSVNGGRRPFAAACHWRTKHCYLLSLCVDGSSTVNRVLCYDYAVGAWWFWDNVPAECWLQAEGEFDNETIYFGDRSGNVYRLGLGDTDNGAAIDAWFMTHRVGYGNNFRHMFKEVDTHGEMQSIPALEVDIYRQDANTPVTATSDWRDELEVPLDTFVMDTDVVEEVRRRYRRTVFRESGRWFKVKVRNTTKNVPMKISSLSFGLAGKV